MAPSPPDFTESLGGAGADAERVGAKAAALDRLIADKYMVPATVVVTAAAFREFVADPELASLIEDLKTRPIPSPTTADGQRKEIEDAFLSAPMPAALAEAVRAACIRLECDVVAVRSSATAEDLQGASFAGQYSTFLGIEGPDAAAEAVRRVWASLWFPWASAYRRQMEVPEDDLSMAVIIQSLIRADRSGVVFTDDPGEPGWIRVEYVTGLGEQLVSGRVTPEVRQLRRGGLHLAAGKGEVDPLIREIARIGLRIEEDAGGTPQDVEWGIEGEEIWVLQARPITTPKRRTDDPNDGFDTPATLDDRYVMAGVTEMLPGVLSPLSWTVNGPMVEDAFRAMFSSLGAPPAGMDRPYGFIGRRRGRARLNLSAIQRAAATMAGWTPADVERLCLGGTSDAAEPAPSPTQRLSALMQAPRAMRIRRKARLEADTFELSVRRVGSKRLQVEQLLLPELVAYRARLRDLAASGVRSEVAVAGMAVAAYETLESTLRRWNVEEAPTWTQRLTRDAGKGVETALSLSLRAFGVCSDDARQEIADTAMLPFDEAREKIGPEGRQFLDQLQDDLDSLGSAAIYAGPVWREQSEYLWQMVRSSAFAPAIVHEGSASEDLTELEKTLSSTTRWRTTRVITGQVVDMRLRMLRKMVFDATDLLTRREQVKGSLLVLGGIERSIDLELARRLAARGLVDRPEDIELLADWELEDLVISGHGPSHQAITSRRAVLSSWRSERFAPPAKVDAVLAGDVLEGWGASPGVAKGIARVVSDPALVEDLEPGSIIVAAATDPSWLPLMLQAGGLIVERGGPLSHAAIVAREFGLPAVLNVAGATARIVDGSIVQLDGASGRIVVRATADALQARPEKA